MAKLSQKNADSNGGTSNTNAINHLANPGMKPKRTRKTIPRDSPTQRSSIYRGVTRHRWTGRYEAHLWDKNCWNEAQNKKGRQATQEEAAIANDMAAIEYRGLNAVTKTNFNLSHYLKWLKPNNSNTNIPNDHVDTDLASSSNHHDTSGSVSQHTSDDGGAALAQPQPVAGTSALGLLLQSSKFKEIMKMTLAAECSSTPCELDPPQYSNFLEDITCFESNDDFISYSDQEDDVSGNLNPSIQFDSVLNGEDLEM